jgi:hypothetical protein
MDNVLGEQLRGAGQGARCAVEHDLCIRQSRQALL